MNLSAASKLLLVSLAMLLAACSAWAIKQRPVREPEVRFVREIWFDTARQRHVNVRIAMPTPEAVRQRREPMPVLLFSAPQGFRWGGYSDHYEELSQEMLARGVVTVTLSHYDIDEPMNGQERFADVYPGIQTGRRNDPAVDRYEDAVFALAHLKSKQRSPSSPSSPSEAWPALNLDRLAVAGHSSGTLTALHLAGMPVRDKQGHIFAAQRDPRIKAFMLFSYPLEYRGPSRDDLQKVGAVAGLHVAGASDHHRYRNTSYRYIHGAPQHWLVAEGGHNIGATGSEALVLDVTGSFIDVYLNNKTALLSRLSPEGLAQHGVALKQFSSKPSAPFKAPDQRDFAAWARSALPGGRWLHDRAIAHARSQEAVAK